MAPRTIDMHAHVLVQEVEALVAGQPGRAAEAAFQARSSSQASNEHNRHLFADVYGPKLTDIPTRLRDMAAMGIEMQAISMSPTQYHYWAEPRLAEKLVETANDRLAAICRETPERFVGLGGAALQHPDLAVEQLRHAVTGLGLRGIEVSTRVGERELAYPGLEPFWAAAEELGAVIFIHPLGCTLGERIAPYYLGNVIGNPVETTVALSHLIFSGVLERYPGLRIVAAHGGGYLPFYIARSDHAYTVRPESHSTAHPPSYYLRRIWFDALVYAPEAVATLVAQVGAGQVVLGTDYPFDMGIENPLERLAAVPGLSEAERVAISGGNAAALLGLV